MRRQITKTGLVPITPKTFEVEDSAQDLASNVASVDLGGGDDVVSPTIVSGMVNYVGTRHEHNEDFGVAIPDLFLCTTNMPKLDPKQYAGAANRTISVYGVYDGHGGGTASKFAHQQLHGMFGEEQWRANTAANVPRALLRSFDRCEMEFCRGARRKNDTAGSCATLVVVRGDKIYCGDAGDSKAMVFEYDPTKSVTVKAAAPVDLNPRHGTELKSERERILKAGGRISASGAVYGVLYPSRGFGDLDVKSQGKDVVIATPEGAGITEGSLQPQEAYTIKKGKTTYMVVASDGLWDFMTDEECIGIVLRGAKAGTAEEALSQKLNDVARKNGSDDDITIIVVKITWP